MDILNEDELKVVKHSLDFHLTFYKILKVLK